MRLLSFFILFSSLSVSSQERTLQLLFVGNSLTYTNNLPRLVALEFKKLDVKVKTKMLAFPNYALEDHWAEGELQKHIQTGKYDFVIIQQGPSSQAEGKEMLIEIGGFISTLCKQSDSKLVYFMVWPSRSYYHTFEGVIENYRQAAMVNEAILCPVGEGWKEHFDETGHFDYYGPDGFHPSLRGSQEAARTIVDELRSEEETR